MFEKMRYQGAGSSMINPTKTTSPKEAFDLKGIAYTYCKGYTESGANARELREEAFQAAASADTVLLFAGLDDMSEGEGYDRETMRLPQHQLDLADALLTSGKKIAVVLFGGSPVELPFADKVNAILDMYLPGQNGGTACAELRRLPLLYERAEGGALSLRLRALLYGLFLHRLPRSRQRRYRLRYLLRHEHRGPCGLCRPSTLCFPP